MGGLFLETAYQPEGAPRIVDQVYPLMPSFTKHTSRRLATTRAPILLRWWRGVAARNGAVQGPKRGQWVDFIGAP